MSEDEILNHIDKHRYFSFTKDDLPKTKRSLDNLRIFGLTELHGQNSIRLTRDGLNALKLGFENWVNQNTASANTMAQELHEKILLYLYKFKTDKDYHNILDEFALHSDKELSNTLEELESKGLLKNEIYLTVLGQDRKRRLKSRITISGIEHVNNLTKKNLNNGGHTLIFHGNIGTVQNINAPNSSGNIQSSDSPSNSVLNIIDSKINAPVNQASDDSSYNKATTNTFNHLTPKEIKQNSSIWTLSNVSFNLFIGIIVAVVGGIMVLIYWEKIKHLFE